MPEVNELNEALLNLQRELDMLSNSATLLNEVKKAAEDAIASAKGVTGATISLTVPMATLKDRLEDATKRLEQIDFPARLDKLDATVSAVNASIQNILARVESAEGNVKERIDNRHQDLKASMKREGESTQKSIQGYLDTNTGMIKDTIKKSTAKLESGLTDSLIKVRNLVIVAVLLGVASIVLHVVLR